jgi:hypothetical protein
MKYLKILAMAAIAAMALTAFVAGSASADVLCKTKPNRSGECETSSGDYPAFTNFTAELSAGTSAVLTITEGATSSVTCANSTVSIGNASTGSNTPGTEVPMEVTDLSFTNCKTAGSSTNNCEVSTTRGYAGGLKATDNSGDGTLKINGNAETLVKCFGFLECKYRPMVSGLSLAFAGGNPATAVAEKQPLAVAPFGFGCGTGADWDATYKTVGENQNVWVATKMA